MSATGSGCAAPTPSDPPSPITDPSDGVRGAASVAAVAMALTTVGYTLLTAYGLVTSDWGLGFLDLALVFLPVLPVLVWFSTLLHYLRRRWTSRTARAVWSIPVAVVVWCLPGVNLLVPFLYLTRVAWAAPSAGARGVRTALVLVWWSGWGAFWATMLPSISERYELTQGYLAFSTVAVTVASCATLAGIVVLSRRRSLALLVPDPGLRLVQVGR